LSLSVWIVVAVWIMDKRHAALGPVLTLYNVLPRGAGGRERERERDFEHSYSLFTCSSTPSHFFFLSALPRVSSSHVVFFMCVISYVAFSFLSLHSSPLICER
jgi:hypothetical protein